MSLRPVYGIPMDEDPYAGPRHSYSARALASAERAGDDEAEEDEEEEEARMPPLEHPIEGLTRTRVVTFDADVYSPEGALAPASGPPAAAHGSVALPSQRWRLQMTDAETATRKRKSAPARQQESEEEEEEEFNEEDDDEEEEEEEEEEEGEDHKRDAPVLERDQHRKKRKPGRSRYLYDPAYCYVCASRAPDPSKVEGLAQIIEILKQVVHKREESVVQEASHFYNKFVRHITKREWPISSILVHLQHHTVNVEAHIVRGITEIGDLIDAYSRRGLLRLDPLTGEEHVDSAQNVKTYMTLQNMRMKYAMFLLSVRKQVGVGVDRKQ